MDESGQWFQQGLSAHQFALEAARSVLVRGEAAAVASVQRVARSLAETARRAGQRDVVRAAHRVAAAEDGDLPERLEELLASIHDIAGEREGEKIHLLVVDDDPVAGRFIIATLEAPNRRVHHCRTAADAEEVLRCHDVALVILDLGLPDGDGRSLLVRLRHRPQYDALPIIVVSGSTGTQPRTECFALGADEFIGKPFDPRSLAGCVAAKLQRAANLTRTARQDTLTDLPDQSAMMRAFDRIRSKRAADGLPLRIGVIRAERLRWINDTFGTTAGDDVLRAAADRLKSLRRPEQIVGRWGGEEFVILMPGISEDDAARWLERAVAGLQSLEFRTPDGRRFCAAFTAGLAESAPAGIVSDPADSAARMLLYLVRMAGHCRVKPDGHGEGFDRHALLVEDDAVTAKLLIGLLRLDGFEVEHVTDGKAAVDAAMRTPAGLVVLDVRLPGLDGFEVIREVRRMPGYDRSPILIVSGARESRDIVRGLELGADDYVIKPFSPVEIRARVRRLLARH